MNPIQKGRQNPTRLLQVLPKKWAHPSWCRKKIRDKDFKQVENKRVAEKEDTLTQDYNRNRGPSYGSEQNTRGQIFQRRNQN